MELYHTAAHRASGYHQNAIWPTLPYVLLPKPLLEEFPHDTIAIGVYSLIARLNKSHRGAVYLSAADMVRFVNIDTTDVRFNACRSRIMWAITRLEDAGWIVITRASSQKHRVICTWGSADKAWDFSTENTGRPKRLHAIQLPTALLDVYIGELQPIAGRKAAPVRCYFSAPLLDLDDVGSYALQRHFAQNAPTPRLRHLQLVDDCGVLPPRDYATLKTEGLTTLDERGQPMQVRERDQGYTFFSQQSRSSSRSSSRSRSSCNIDDEIPHREAENQGSQPAFCSNAMDDRKIEKQIDSATIKDHDQVAGSMTPMEASVGVSPDVKAAHQFLNQHRIIAIGEWHEIAAIESQYGTTQICVWQARAMRSKKQQKNIVPAYYHQCAARAALENYRPPLIRRSVPPTDAQATEQTKERLVTEQQGAIINPVPLDQEHECIVAAIEAATGERIIKRVELQQVSLDMLRHWQRVITHNGLAARFVHPLGFAIEMMLRGCPPPPDRQLERWASSTVRSIGDTTTAFAQADERLQQHCVDNLAAWKAAGIGTSDINVSYPDELSEYTDIQTAWQCVLRDLPLSLLRIDHALAHNLHLVAITDSTITVRVPHLLYQKAVNYVNLMRSMLAEWCGTVVGVRLVIAPHRVC